MLASAVAVGLIAGFARGGSLGRLAGIRVAWWPVLAAAVLVRLAAGLAGDLAGLAYVAAFAGIVAVALANRALPGALLIAVGAALNLVVVAANGAMPISADALALVDGPLPRDPLHVPLTDASRLALLADVIPFPVVRTAYSAGDVLLAVGGARLAYTSVRRA
jgi:hypothetical protein